MNQTEQIPLLAAFEAGEPLWFGATIDHRDLLEALQDEWLRPKEGALARTLGVRSFPTWNADVSDSNRIIVYLKFAPSCLPHVRMPVRHGTTWRASLPKDISATDEEILW